MQSLSFDKFSPIALSITTKPLFSFAVVCSDKVLYLSLILIQRGRTYGVYCWFSGVCDHTSSVGLVSTALLLFLNSIQERARAACKGEYSHSIKLVGHTSFAFPYTIHNSNTFCSSHRVSNFWLNVGINM